MKKDDSVTTHVLAFMFGVFLTMLVITLTFPVPRMLKELRARAVELGAASWVVDPKTGETTFTWKDGKP